MRITICGDISICGEGHRVFAAGDTEAAFHDVTKLYEVSDRVIVNLECVLTESDGEIAKIGPCLKGPVQTAQTLKKAGVTDCMLSNNHIFDFGIRGLRDTIQRVEEAGLSHTGIGENYEDSRKDLVMEKDGVTISVINVCEHEYSYATENRIGARPFDEFETMEDIRRAKRETDRVVVIYHGGKEYCRYPSPRLRKACREMVLCGADAVLCQHSHIIGCYEEFEGSHILYGQGNFYFLHFSDDPTWNEGLLVMLDMDKEKNEISLIPVIKKDGGIEIAKGEELERIAKGICERNEQLQNGEWKKGWHDFCVGMYDVYKNAFCGYDVKDDAAGTQLFSHYLDCEAHTDVWRELFPTWNHTNEL